MSIIYFHAPPLSVWTRSKSLSNIPMVYPVRKSRDGGQDTGIAREWNQENNKYKCTVATKDSEAQWQDVSLEKSNTYDKTVWLQDPFGIW